MANLPHTISFGKFAIYVDDGTLTTPPVYVAPCALTKKTLKIENQTSDTVIVDCDDPDAPAWLLRNNVSRSGEISGSGALAGENCSLWAAWATGSAAGADSRPIKMVQNGAAPGSQGGGVWTGNGILSSYQEDTDRKSEGGRVQVSITIQSDGPWTYTPNAG